MITLKIKVACDGCGLAAFASLREPKDPRAILSTIDRATPGWSARGSTDATPRQDFCPSCTRKWEEALLSPWDRASKDTQE